MIINLKFYGLAVIGLLLAAIIIAFIFSSKFREDVIASEGEASVFGMINVKGVIVVLLSALFIGALVYIIQMDNSSTSEINTASAIHHLNEIEGEKYSLNYNPNASCLELMVNGTSIGKLSQGLNLDLNASKGKNRKEWYIKVGKLNLGMISLKTEQGNRSWHPGQNPKVYEQGKAYQVQNMNFFFMIDSIYNKKIDTVLLPCYTVSFGERNAGVIKWHRDKFTFNKTANGRIDLKNDLMCLTDPAWKNDYYIGFGVGLPGGDEQAHVEMLNTFVVKISLD